MDNWKILGAILDKHVSVEVELNTARVVVEAEQEFRSLKKSAIPLIVISIRYGVNWNLALNCVEVKSDTIVEQIETEFTWRYSWNNLAQEWWLKNGKPN